ncbi:shikimate kinase [Leucobacter sp. CX328]|uniref:shikimate kinase n=1 Tax=unclassified Leucobacter TaxID=2621730 RepID=UPI0033413D46
MSKSRRAARPAGPPSAVAEERPKPAPPVQRAMTAPIVVPTRKVVHSATAASDAPGLAKHDAAASSGAAAQQQGGKPNPRRRRRRGGGKRLPDRAIVFVGPMAAGKTSLGKRVARDLGIPFVDSDAVFVRQYGVITEFFAEHGEAEFRRLEAEIIAAELAEQGTKVLALGGGAVLTDSTRALLAEHPTILLMTTQEAVLRTANLSRRPLLRDDPNAWGRILESRKPLYLEVAQVTFRTDRATKEQLSRRVTQWVRGYARKQQAAAGDSGEKPPVSASESQAPLTHAQRAAAKNANARSGGSRAAARRRAARNNAAKNSQPRSEA